MSDEWVRAPPAGLIPTGLVSVVSGGTEGTVDEDGDVRIDVGDSTATLYPTEDIDAEAGETVEVSLRGREVHVRTTEDARQAKRAALHARARKEYERAQRLDAKREAAADFWSRYDLPFDHDVAIRGRRSGLLRGSHGDGRDSRTKNHLYVSEAFETDDGRLSREADTYLCRSTLPSYEFTDVRAKDSDGEEYRPAVTCETCLDRMSRWRVEGEEGDR